MKLSINKVNLANAIVILLGTALLLCFGIYNKYPIVYSDSGTYIASCFQKFIPIDRPIAYSFFIKHSSLSTTLWLTVIAQSWILAFLIFKLIQKSASGFLLYFSFLSLISLLVVFTGISYYSSQVMADVFTGFIFLSFVLLAIGGNKKWENITYCIVFCFSISVHFSHLLSIVMVVLISLTYLFIKKRNILNKAKKKLLVLLMLLFASYFINPVIGLVYADSLVWRPQGSHAFLINRFNEAGILNDFLRKDCVKHNSVFCEFKDIKFYDLLWDAQSPLVKHGGWMNVKDESDRIINEVLTDKKYLWWLFKDNFIKSWQQLINIELQTPGKYLKDSPPEQVVHWHFKNEYDTYFNSKQNKGEFNLGFINTIQPVFILIALFFGILFSIYLYRNQSQLGAILFIICILYILSNAYICSAFSVVNSRFTGRIIWLIPLCTSIMFLEMLNFRKRKIT